MTSSKLSESEIAYRNKTNKEYYDKYKAFVDRFPELKTIWRRGVNVEWPVSDGYCDTHMPIHPEPLLYFSMYDFMSVYMSLKLGRKVYNFEVDKLLEVTSGQEAEYHG